MVEQKVQLEVGERALFAVIKKITKAFRREGIVYTSEPEYFEIYLDLGHPDDDIQFQLYVMMEVEDDQLRVTDYDEVKDFFICGLDEVEELVTWLKTTYCSRKVGKLVCA